MANKTQRVIIDSILGGESATSHFASEGQFYRSLGINPALHIQDSDTNLTPSGLVRPLAVAEFTTDPSSSPMWFVTCPAFVSSDTGTVYVYDYQGSLYSVDSFSLANLTAISDGGSLTASRGNGAAYYDNYLYLAKNTTVARYGPMTTAAASRTFDGNYWAGTLGKTALTDEAQYSYSDDNLFIGMPNHVLHRHSDGKLYIADVNDNYGYIHTISTTKTTVAGDTDNGSAYQKLRFGWGVWPTAMCSLGSMLVIALTESGSIADNGYRNNLPAKLAFWDTTSQNYNEITLDEFPDNIITAIKNVNGVLYLVSGLTTAYGFRVSRYVGGSSFEEVSFIGSGQVPFPGAVYAKGDSFYFGSSTRTPEVAGVVYSLGLGRRSIFGDALFTSLRTPTGTTTTVVTAISKDFNYPNSPMFAGYTSSGLGSGLCTQTGSSFLTPDYSKAPSVWWSQIYRVGQPFKITKIRIPLVKALTSGAILTAKVYFDDGQGEKTLTEINRTNFGNNTQNIVIRPQNLSADSNFWLELRWTGTDLCVVSLPITIEYEIIDIDTAYA